MHRNDDVGIVYGAFFDVVLCEAIGLFYGSFSSIKIVELELDGCFRRKVLDERLFLYFCFEVGVGNGHSDSCEGMWRSIGKEK